MSIAVKAAPADFDVFWAGMLDELAALPAAPELTVNHLRSTDFATMYDLHLTSIGPYRIYGFFSVPKGKGEGPFPTLVHTGGYGSVVHIASYEERQNYVTLSLRVRGKRLADQPYAAAFPGMLTDGIESPNTYVFRGVVADCVRAVDFLLSRPEVDNGKIALHGDDIAIITAALRPEVDALYASPALFYAAHALAPKTSGYPLEELNDYARTYPNQAGAMWNTLNYFDPIHFAPQVQASTVLVTGNEKDLHSPEALTPLADAFSAPPEQRVSAHSSYKDGVAQATWLANRYNLGEPVLPPHWQG